MRLSHTSTIVGIILDTCEKYVICTVSFYLVIEHPFVNGLVW